ncbi:hypothetical protein Ddc_17060 [Ditylenchus destructor]|nr:hypothetical protein Ddc_17060 [Ditylenchus destructor]
MNRTSAANSISDSLPPELLSAALSFIDRPELLLLCESSQRIDSVYESDFANVAKPFLILDRFSVAHEWTVNGGVADCDLLEKVATTKYLRFKTTEISWRTLVEYYPFLERMSHVWKEQALSVSSWNSVGVFYNNLAVEPSPEMIDMISTCRDLSIDGPTVMAFLPQILQSETLERLSVFDNLLAGTQSNGVLPVREIVDFLVSSAGSGKRRVFHFQNSLHPGIMQNIFALIGKKFMDCTTPVSFSIKWPKHFRWTYEAKFTENPRIRQGMRIRQEMTLAKDNVLEVYDC